MIEIRPAEVHEYDAIAALMLAVNRATYGEQARLYEAFVTDIPARAKEAEILVALDEDTIVGAVAYVPNDMSPLAENLDAEEAGVRMLAVDQSFARRGIGAALTRVCIERARRAGKARLRLHADTNHPPALALYERLNFEPDPSRDRLAGDGTPLVAFKFELAD